MSIEVNRVGKVVLAKNRDLDTLRQSFRISEVPSETVADILMNAPMVGSGSLFGARPGIEAASEDGSRHLQAFSPAPGFQFDLQLKRVEALVFVVRFSQPDRASPYLAGELAWFLNNEGPGCLFNEEINTPEAAKLCKEPLRGTSPSLRRWLFFRVGHPQVMTKLMTNLAELADRMG